MDFMVLNVSILWYLGVFGIGFIGHVYKFFKKMRMKFFIHVDG